MLPTNAILTTHGIKTHLIRTNARHCVLTTNVSRLDGTSRAKELKHVQDNFGLVKSRSRKGVERDHDVFWNALWYLVENTFIQHFFIQTNFSPNF